VIVSVKRAREPETEGRTLTEEMFLRLRFGVSSLERVEDIRFELWEIYRQLRRSIIVGDISGNVPISDKKHEL
jgi:hypothetical protein